MTSSPIKVFTVGEDGVTLDRIRSEIANARSNGRSVVELNTKRDTYSIEVHYNDMSAEQFADAETGKAAKMKAAEAKSEAAKTEVTESREAAQAQVEKKKAPANKKAPRKRKSRAKAD